MDLEELEREIRMHRRGRRNELLVIGAVAAVAVLVVGGLLLFVLL